MKKPPGSLLKLPFVEVTWRDACSCSRWESVEDFRASTTLECKTTGRLFSKDRRSVKIASSVAENGTVSDTTIIPTPWVTRIRRLK